MMGNQSSIAPLPAAGADANADANNNRVTIHVPIDGATTGASPAVNSSLQDVGLGVSGGVPLSYPTATASVVAPVPPVPALHANGNGNGYANGNPIVPPIAVSAVNANGNANGNANAAVNEDAPYTPSGADTPGRTPKQTAAEAAAQSAYMLELQRQKKLLPAVPNVTVTFKDLDVSVPIPVVDRGFETLGGKLFNLVTCAGLRGKNKTRQFDMIRGATGVVRPGTLTLILAPPGHGKSTLLKALSTRVAASAGYVAYNGLTKDEAERRGVYPHKLVQYVDQADVHNPLLTVKETFQFAVDNFSVDPSTLPDGANLDAKAKADLKALHESKADNMVNMLGLGECANTILGNALLRGVSGGQKKRVTLGETLLSEARVLCLDEVTNGLDSSTALDVFRSLRTWAHVTGGSVVAALQQPTPELFGCFDELIMLKEGAVVYNGSTAHAIPHLESIGYFCPPDSDFCDFMVEFLTHPRFVYAQQQSRASVVTPPQGYHGFDAKQNDAKNGSVTPGYAANSIEMTPMKSPTDMPAGAVPSSTEELIAAFKQTSSHKEGLQQIEHLEKAPHDATAQAILLNDYCRSLYGGVYTHPFVYHVSLTSKRQSELNKRNKGLIGPRIGQSIIMSLLLGSLFYKTGITQFPERIALILFALTFVAFGNMSELPIAVEAKRVLYKQTDAGLFPTSAYVLSVIICHMPLLIVETTIFSIVLYFLSEFTTNAGAFFVFWALMLCSGLCMSVFFRMLAFVAPNEELAQAMAGPSTGIFMLFGGFFITRNSVPDFMIWLYWLSPFSWSVRSLAVNEFRQTRYTEYNTGSGTVDIGQLYLDTYEMQSEKLWIWAGALLLIGYFIALSILSVIVLTYKRYELSRGTRRFEEETSSAGSTRLSTVEVAHASPNGAGKEQHAAAAASSMPFTPASLSFKNLHYTVTLPDGKTKRKLLTDVSGYAKPKTLTALMGVSGAGKTTLMDVIAFRKTQGKIEGDILVNGKKLSPSKFARLTGYVEQEDIHNPTATVRETLLFAAHLRLPESVPSATKEQFVDEILELLELKEISDSIIGNAVILGLSPGQLKRVTIGVELVANPTILFLDEPTTGLDSRSAYTVMRVVKKIAASGRSVVCTIHQPSAELFYMFDHLLLLAPGGVQTYFGAVGHRGRDLVKYFEELGAPRKPRRLNPASWMLDVIGAGTGANKEAVSLDVKADANGKAVVAAAPASVDFGAKYATSNLATHCLEQLNLLHNAPAGNGADAGDEQLTKYATGLGTQFYHYMIRLFRSYWRNIPFVWNRGIVLLVLSVVFGLVYFDLKIDTQGGVLSKVSVMFVTGGFAGIIHSATSLPVLMDQRPVYYRERASNTYSSIVYSLSIAVVELPTIAVLNAMFLSIFYFMVGLNSDGELWGKYYFAHYMLSLCYMSMCQFLTSVMPNKLAAGIVQGMYFSNFFLFGGMLMNGSNIPRGWKWMWYITPVHYALESLVMPQFAGVTDAIPIVQGISTQITPVTQYVSDYLAFPYGNYWTPLGWLALWILVVRILIILAMEKINFLKR